MDDSKHNQGTSRREALKKLALGTGALTSLPILGQAAPRAAHSPTTSAATLKADPDWKPRFFDAHQNETVIALSELIIPETDTPGAKAALANRFMDLWLREEDEATQRQAIEGLAWMDGRSLSLHGKPFVNLNVEEQTALLTPLADPHNSNPADQAGMQAFQNIKDPTIFAYYTSQLGMEKELQYGGDDYHTEFPGACTHPEHQS